MKLSAVKRVACPDLEFWRAEVTVEGDSNYTVTKALCNIPGPRVVWHSPDGYEWGYCGSGPADLALNILHYCLPVGCDGEPAEKLFRGQCSAIACKLHQHFKEHFIARLPKEGGTIPGALVDAWIQTELEKLMQPEGITSAAFDPDDFTDRR
jgi:hypothetical protein